MLINNKNIMIYCVFVGKRQQDICSSYVLYQTYELDIWNATIMQNVVWFSFKKNLIIKFPQL